MVFLNQLTYRYMWQTNFLRFSFSWTISNFSASNFVELQSPEVPCHTAKWHLILSSKLVDGTSKLGLYIKARGLKTPLEIKYNFSIVDVKNETVCNHAGWNRLGVIDWVCGSPEFIDAQEINVQNGLLVNGSLTFLVEIVAVNPVTENEMDFHHSAVSMACEEPVSETCTETKSELVDDLRRDLGSLLEREELSDLTISIQGKQFLAHKAVVAVRCPRIANLIWEKSGGITSKSREQQHQSDGSVGIVLDDIDSDIFGDVLTFLYTGSISDESLAENGEQLLRAAEILQLVNLKYRAEEALITSPTQENAVRRLVLAYEYNCERLKEPYIKVFKQLKNWKQIVKSFMHNHPEILLDLLDTLLDV